MKILTLENMKYMDIDQIVDLYRQGYIPEDVSLNTLQDNCSAPMFGSFLLGMGLGGFITALIIKSVAERTL